MEEDQYSGSLDCLGWLYIIFIIWKFATLPYTGIAVRIYIDCCDYWLFNTEIY